MDFFLVLTHLFCEFSRFIEGYHYDWHFREMVFQTFFFFFCFWEGMHHAVMQLPAISAGVSNFKDRTGFKSQNLSFAGKETDPTKQKGKHKQDPRCS